MVHKLSIVSYNCQCANDPKLPFLRELYDKCDFLLLQEHGLFKSQFGWFDKIDEQNGVGKCGVSAMNEEILLTGRPHGGVHVAIIWKSNMKLSAAVTWQKGLS